MDAARGYTADNVVWTHKAVNRSRRALSITAFVGWCVAIAAYHDRRAVLHAPLDALPLFAQAIPAV